MPPRPRYPGVYVQETSSGLRAIAGVPTSITLFIGMALEGNLNHPTTIHRLDQFERIFGGDLSYGEMALQVKQFFLNGGDEAIIVRVGSEAGGIPELADYETAFRVVASEVELFNLLVLPRGFGQTDDQRQPLWASASVFCQRQRAFLIVDPRSDWQTAADAAAGVAALRTGAVTDHAGIYWPRILSAYSALPIDPAGTVAGIMSRIDAQRGVWKAPAGKSASVLGVTGLEYFISNSDISITNPQGVNTLRQLPGGVMIWGARTMAGFENSGENEYKYIPVRRAALAIEESLTRGLEFARFESNGEHLWAQIRSVAGAFMQNLFQQGAFQGAKASDAWFVRCDSSTTTQSDIDLGRVNLMVGFAPMRPAEFVILRVQQSLGSQPGH
ncbi:phage tail sheath subtilisin-like domain-containing protein [Marinobacter sp. 1_MG-2023]|uniref:phage tail sheath family protein n=1 Tax=Marinobacter sp. 1_MG-2023 TaxID=3062627 RepID=UPI0026E2639E|nr:phage tail sheath subtilisin-like domain-containing protein [Marinobacter sp. 1_MG-2023]MDO6824829.1 phage tail sheath subtilisin-like domain-containing protein [Marinobacter sp. 1_MG-2023]